MAVIAGEYPYRMIQRCSDVKAHEIFRKYCAGRQPFGFRAEQRRSALGRRLAWRRLARRWLAWRLARRRMGLGSGLRCGLCPRICLGCRTRLGLGTWLGTWLGQSIWVRVRVRSPLRLGACPSLAVRSSGTALGLALLVIPALPAGSLEHRTLAQEICIPFCAMSAFPVPLTPASIARAIVTRVASARPSGSPALPRAMRGSGSAHWPPPAVGPYW